MIRAEDGWARDHATGVLLVPSDPADWPAWRWPLRRLADLAARGLLWAAERCAGPWFRWSPRPLPTGAELIVTTYPYGLGCAAGCGRKLRAGDLSYSFDEGPVDEDDPENTLRWVTVGYCVGCAAERELSA